MTSPRGDKAWMKEEVLMTLSLVNLARLDMIDEYHLLKDFLKSQPISSVLGSVSVAASR